MNDQVRTPLISKILLTIGVVAVAAYLYKLQSGFSFMLEDLLFRVNPKTGEEITSLSDVFSSIVPNIQIYGGSIISNTVLSLILLAGENVADAINVIFLVICAVLICRVLRARHQRFFIVAVSFFSLICLNDDWIYSFCWEFGIVNFFLPAIWYLGLLWLFAMEMLSIISKHSWWWMVLGCICAALCSWSNSGYGLICLFTCVLGCVLQYKLHGGNIPAWMYGASVSAFIPLVVNALMPGNYTDQSIYLNDYLDMSIFPSVVICLFMLAILLRTGGYLDTFQILILGALGFSVFLRFIVTLIPGVMPAGILVCSEVLAIMLMCSFLYFMNKVNNEYRKYGYLLALCTFIYAMLIIAENLLGVM